MILSEAIAWAMSPERARRIVMKKLFAFLTAMVMLLGCAYALKKEEDIWI